jgi:hypothetical protein
MRAVTNIERLTVARPAILDHTHLVVDPAEEDRILADILASERDPSPARAPLLSRLPLATRSPVVTATMAAAIAITVAAGVLAASGAFTERPAAPGHATIDAQALAYRTATAVGRAVSEEIEYVQATYTPAEAGFAAIDVWQYGGSTQEYAFTASGAPISKDSVITSNGTVHVRSIDYRSRTWREVSAVAVKTTAGDVASQVRDLLKLPGSTVEDVTLPNGDRGFRVTSPPWTFNQVLNPDGPTQQPLAYTSNTVWIPGTVGAPAQVRTTTLIDATTYLPVRMTIADRNGKVINAATYTWLAPTPANLAVVTHPVPIPAGFKGFYASRGKLIRKGGKVISTGGNGKVITMTTVPPSTSPAR